MSGSRHHLGRRCTALAVAVAMIGAACGNDDADGATDTQSAHSEAVVEDAYFEVEYLTGEPGESVFTLVGVIDREGEGIAGRLLDADGTDLGAFAVGPEVLATEDGDGEWTFEELAPMASDDGAVEVELVSTTETSSEEGVVEIVEGVVNGDGRWDGLPAASSARRARLVVDGRVAEELTYLTVVGGRTVLVRERLSVTALTDGSAHAALFALGWDDLAVPLAVVTAEVDDAPPGSGAEGAPGSVPGGGGERSVVPASSGTPAQLLPPPIPVPGGAAPPPPPVGALALAGFGTLGMAGTGGGLGSLFAPTVRPAATSSADYAATLQVAIVAAAAFACLGAAMGSAIDGTSVPSHCRVDAVDRPFPVPLPRVKSDPIPKDDGNCLAEARLLEATLLAATQLLRTEHPEGNRARNAAGSVWCVLPNDLQTTMSLSSGLAQPAHAEAKIWQSFRVRYPRSVRGSFLVVTMYSPCTRPASGGGATCANDWASFASEYRGLGPRCLYLFDFDERADKVAYRDTFGSPVSALPLPTSC